jgi:hypothetical protein
MNSNLMKNCELLPSTWSNLLTLLAFAAGALPCLHVARAAQEQNIHSIITLDREHTSIVDRLPTGAGVNEFRGDAPNAAAVNYTWGESGGRVAAGVGRNFSIALDGNTSSKANGGRTAFLDLSDPFDCVNSVKVDVDHSGVCDPCVNTTPLLPDTRFGPLDADDVSGFPDNIHLSIAGQDYDDLIIGCTVQTWARLEFPIGTSGSEAWVLFWGPFRTAGITTHNPESSPLAVTRVSPSEWRFQTTGNHDAALYYRNRSWDHEYHGQFTVKFSGKAVALPNQTLPPGTHCNILVSAGLPACSP